jgi:hypothetical protein
MYGFKEVLKYSNVIACLNLKYIKAKREFQKYPSLLAAETSIFTQRINGHKHLTEQFTSLSYLIADQVSIISNQNVTLFFKR